MDDNHLLIEWLAYHYHALPLRNLVLAVDPRSRTTPDDVLARWKTATAMTATTAATTATTATSSTASENATSSKPPRPPPTMEIERWDDADYVGSKAEWDDALLQVRRYFARIGIENRTLLTEHRARQRLFFYKCLRHHKRKGRGYAALIDTDEFLRVNYRRSSIAGEEGAKQQQKNATAMTTTAAAVSSLVPPPPMDEPGSVLKLLRRELGNWTTSPCVQIPRVRFGAVESRSRLEVTRSVPSGFDALQFLTMRWRKRASYSNYRHNKISKAIVDLSRIDWDDLQPVDSVHLPIRAHCRQRGLHVRADDHPLVINHYLGSWEQYSYRSGDSRVGNERGRAEYDKVSGLGQETDDEIRPWLKGFVRDVGIPEARRLLDGVGILVERGGGGGKEGPKG